MLSILEDHKCLLFNFERVCAGVDSSIRMLAIDRVALDCAYYRATGAVSVMPIEFRASTALTTIAEVGLRNGATAITPSAISYTGCRILN